MKKILSHSLSMIVLLSLFAMVMVMVMLASAQVLQMADELRVENATGNPGDYVLVPVNITNVKSGPIMVIGLRHSYNTSVLNLTGVEFGDLTKEGWALTIGKKIILDTGTDNAMLSGSTNSIVLLNFSVIGKPGETSYMNLTDIVLVNISYQGGTIPAKNGTFTIPPTPIPSPSPTEPPTGGGGGGAIAPMDTDDAVISTPTPLPTITSTVTPTVSTTCNTNIFGNDKPTVTSTVSPTVISSPTPIPSYSPTSTPTPTPRPPGFEAIFAIADLLAVAYLVMRRRKAY